MKKRTKKIVRRVIVTTVCTASLAALFAKGYSLSPKKFERQLSKAGVKISTSATYGGLNDERFNSKEFSLVDAGNYTVGMPDKSKELLEDTNKPTGIIINSGAKSFFEIYKEVDYVKELVREYDIEYPICLDMSKVFYANVISESELNILVNSFVRKLQANGLTVYVIGDDYLVHTLLMENANNDEYYTNYPIGLIWDYKTDKIDLDYDLIIGDKYIYSKKDFKSNYVLNSASTFVEDFVYTASDEDTFKSVGEQMGIPGDDLRRYNSNTVAFDLKENDRIVIPNKYHKPYALGVDISEWQGNIDFSKLSDAGVKFAISRAGYTEGTDKKEYLVDSYFNHYSLELSKKGIAQGAYYYTKAFNFVEMDKEVELLLRTVEGHDITLPLYIDIEGETATRLDNDDTRELELDLIGYFCSRIKQAGYTPGIYINKKYNKYLEKISDNVAIWNCGGYYYNTEQNIDNMYYTNALDENITIYQNTDKGSGKDLGAQSQYICLDYADVDFVKTKKMN